MEGGKLRHAVDLKRPSDDRGVGGKRTGDSFATIARVRASINPVAGGEAEAHDRQEASVTHEVRIRHYAGLGATWRLGFGTRTLEVVRVLNVDERSREMVLACREIPS